MNKLKIIKNLGFDIDALEKTEMIKECQSLLELFLEPFYIDEKIKKSFVYKYEDDDKVIDASKSCHMCRGFGYDNDSYDFCVITNRINNDFELIVKPTIQKKFTDPNFGESFSIFYDSSKGILNVDRIHKENYDLVSESYKYVRDSKSNKLVLIGNRNVFDGITVSNYDKRINDLYDLRCIYNNGTYFFERFLKPKTSKLLVTSRDIAAVQKLYLDGKDTFLVLHNGTVIYDMNHLDLEHPLSVTNFENKKVSKINSDSLISCLNDYYKIDNKFSDLKTYIKK